MSVLNSSSESVLSDIPPPVWIGLKAGSPAGFGWICPSFTGDDEHLPSTETGENVHSQTPSTPKEVNEPMSVLNSSSESVLSNIPPPVEIGLTGSDEPAAAPASPRAPAKNNVHFCTYCKGEGETGSGKTRIKCGQCNGSGESIPQTQGGDGATVDVSGRGWMDSLRAQGTRSPRPNVRQMFEAELQSVLEEEKAGETDPLSGPRNRLADLEEKTAQEGTQEPVQETWRVAARMQERTNLFPRPSTETISGLTRRSKRKLPAGSIELLMAKTRDGCVSEVEVFLQQYPQVVTQKDTYGNTVLHTVANQRFCNPHDYIKKLHPGQKLYKVLQIGEKLIKHAHDQSYDLPNARDKNGDTPLDAAVVMENPCCVEMLLEQKADGTIRNKDGKTAEDLISRTTEYTDAIREAFMTS